MREQIGQVGLEHVVAHQHVQDVDCTLLTLLRIRHRVAVLVLVLLQLLDGG